MKETIYLSDPQQAYRRIKTLWAELKPWLIAGHELELIVRPKRRNTMQNALLHALLTDISRQIKWAGMHQDVETWKRLLTAAWLRARGKTVAILPAIDGHGVDVVFRHTSELTASECAELIEFVLAWGAESGVRFSTSDHNGER